MPRTEPRTQGHRAIYEGLVHESLVERDIVEEDIGGAHGDGSVDVHGLRLRLSPHTTDQLRVFLSRPQRILKPESARTPNITIFSTPETYDDDHNVRKRYVKPDQAHT